VIPLNSTGMRVKSADPFRDLSRGIGSPIVIVFGTIILVVYPFIVTNKDVVFIIVILVVRTRTRFVHIQILPSSVCNLC
jgi:hypothetical protein